MQRRVVEPVKEPELDLSHLTLEESQAIQQVVSTFSNLFSERPGNCQIVTHDIQLTCNKPCKAKPYRYDKQKELIIEEHINEMLQNQIISPINSDYASPVVLCRKKNDFPPSDKKAWRFAIDYRKLNSITKFPVYPLPVIEEIIRKIKSTRYMTTLDLTSGYYQIAMKPEDIHKTAFITKSGTYAFLRMPFGLCGAPSTFQRAMDIVLKPVLGKSTLIYLDDIIITSSSLEQHIKDLQEVFSLLKEAGLTINASKCKFATKELKYLGYKISQKGIETQDSKIKAIKSFPPPKTAKKLSSFLGLCSYYRSFIKDFANIVEPLLVLKRKKSKFTWTAEANTAFEKLKEALINAPVLKFPEGDENLEIAADASDYAIGAVLMQKGHPLAFFSKTLNATQRNYTATERETLAVLMAVQKFRVHFGKAPVTVFSDHAAVGRLYSGKNLTPRLIRWALKLQEYNLIIKYKPGKENNVADALSRIKLDDEGNELKCTVLTSKIIDSRETIIAELKADPEFGNIYAYLKDPDNFENPDVAAIRSRAQNYEIIDNLLFYTKSTNENFEYRPVIPASLRLSILKELHDAPTSGHLGIRKTIKRVREAVYFPQLYKIVTAYVRSCKQCQLINDINYSPAGYLNSIRATFPNEILGIDLLGPFPQSELNKNRYLLVIVDHFSKWTEIVALKRASAKTVADAFLHRYIFKYGAPIKVISDNGKQFVSQIFENICSGLGIRHIKMVPYRPQANIAERVNKNIVKIIRSYVSTHHKRWDGYIDELAYALRTAIHDSTGKTPAELFLGRKLITPLDKLFFVQQREQEFRQKDVQKLIHEAVKNSDMARNRQQIYYNRKRREADFKVGDKVLKRKFCLSNAPEYFSAKLAPRFEGPYIIQEIKGAILYLKNERGETCKASPDQVKKFYEKNDFEVLKSFLQDSSSQQLEGPEARPSAPPPKKQRTAEEPKKQRTAEEPKKQRTAEEPKKQRITEEQSPSTSYARIPKRRTENLQTPAEKKVKRTTTSRKKSLQDSKRKKPVTRSHNRKAESTQPRPVPDIQRETRPPILRKKRQRERKDFNQQKKFKQERKPEAPRNNHPGAKRKRQEPEYQHPKRPARRGQKRKPMEESQRSQRRRLTAMNSLTWTEFCEKRMTEFQASKNPGRKKRLNDKRQQRGFSTKKLY
ncbi:Transposon Ty3-I Gag-Pol polyprotein, partial [Stegodyphus mimosarum]